MLNWWLLGCKNHCRLEAWLFASKKTKFTADQTIQNILRPSTKKAKTNLIRQKHGNKRANVPMPEI